ncbi:unnamed protein product [Urochloa decumbens]|uniref:Zinc finger GRF-type domain-containing protein n=1 Tax=Urochloa decumbens TaxID=240449 RepID=A0ABC9F6D4_9POAL
MRVGSSPMRPGCSSTMSASGGKHLRLVECPKCGVPVVKIRSKQKETYGELFFKCPNNIKGDSRTCGFIRSEEEYESYLHSLERKEVDEVQCFGDGHEVLRWQCLELRQDLGMMKQQLDVAVLEISNIQKEISELKEQRKAFFMNNPVAVAGCVGLVIGLLMRALWK